MNILLFQSTIQLLLIDNFGVNKNFSETFTLSRKTSPAQKTPRTFLNHLAC